MVAFRRWRRSFRDLGSPALYSRIDFDNRFEEILVELIWVGSRSPGLVPNEVLYVLLQLCAFVVLCSDGGTQAHTIIWEGAVLDAGQMIMLCDADASVLAAIAR